MRIKMADKEVKITIKCYILIVVFSDLLLANALHQNFHQTKLVFETDASSLPMFNRHNDIEENNGYLHNLAKRAVAYDDVCKNLNDQLQRNLTGTFIHHTYMKRGSALAVAWVGENNKNLIIVTVVNEGFVEYSRQSTVFRSVDYGATYLNLTQSFGLSVIKKHSGLQRHPNDANKVYLIGEGNYMYTTADGGLSFLKIDLPFSVSGELIFSNYNRDHLMALDTDKKLFVSKDNGANWKQVNIQENVNNEKKFQKAVWGIKPEEDEDQGTNPDTANTIYFTYGSSAESNWYHNKSNGLTLAKSTDGGNTYTDLLSAVISFERKGKFLFASQSIFPDEFVNGPSQIRISTDGGNNFQKIKIPTTAPPDAFRVVDIDHNRIFVHVDEKDGTGLGTLYISDSQGLLYSRSLNRHMFANYNDVSGFYKVKSMRGVYMTSQISRDGSIHTKITYNRGADWQNISRPDGVPCKNESKDCYLQIHGMYSIKRGINTELPISQSTAVGLILAHGHVADALQKTDPDVFVSRDGGYTWHLALEGPHFYEMGGYGGLVVAISNSESYPQIVKFSFDEGRCWHEYKFTEKNLNITGILANPTSLAVMVFGYISSTKQWDVTVIDFRRMVQRKCSNDDYESWTTLNTNNSSEVKGCVLGTKETFKRLKKDSLCFKGHDYVVNNTMEECVCTKEDYECWTSRPSLIVSDRNGGGLYDKQFVNPTSDYGYMRDGVPHECIKETFFRAEVNKCLSNYDTKNFLLGYRKIPGNKCVGGFSPPSITDSRKMCNESHNTTEKTPEVDEPQGISKQPDDTTSRDKQISKTSKKIKRKQSVNKLAITVPVAVVTILLVVSILGIFLARKYVSQRRGSSGKIVWHTKGQDI
ncbi:sortilin-like isoform X3 [Mercenaria mercenaria]|uniref:sortilin-like isoform X3 n=1 Tax=Mercenaria mercenaria TaxID=6596 RepID=UPI00234E4D6C|nr:sortilin-like isoform X3 [Mercenaria mercenaria]